MPKWLSILLHVLSAAGGVAGAILGHPEAVIASSAINAALPPPQQKKNVPCPTCGAVAAQGQAKH
jgi:hypothetical protein